MKKELYLKIINDYKTVKEKFRYSDLEQVSIEVAESLKEYSFLFKKVFSFLLICFSGKLRRDGKTPLVFHSIYLTRLLYLMGEKNLDTLLLASLHDVLEDTSIEIKDLKKQSFMNNYEYLIPFLEILKENKQLSRTPDGKNLPERYKEHIKRLIGAPSNVINVEIADRFSDLMDLEYILNLPAEEKNKRLISKLLKTKSFVENLIRGRNDINNDLKNLFFFRVKFLEKKYNLSVKGEIIS